MRFTQLTIEDVVDYLRLDDDSDLQLEDILNAAQGYVRSYTGLSDTTLDQIPEASIAALVLCQDMYDNRTVYSDKGNPNRTIETILNMHRCNLI